MLKDVTTTFWRVLAPLPCILVTCISKEGKYNIITVGWNMPVSIKPPCIAISIGTKRYSYGLLKESGEFVINIPEKNIIEKVQYCGITSGIKFDKFKETGLTPLPARKVKPPIIKECIGHIECKIVKSIESGDHTLFIGEVLCAYAEESLYTNAWDVSKAKPLQTVIDGTYTIPQEPIKLR